MKAPEETARERAMRLTKERLLRGYIDPVVQPAPKDPGLMKEVQAITSKPNLDRWGR